jgi:hypothetical protein
MKMKPPSHPHPHPHPRFPRRSGVPDLPSVASERRMEECRKFKEIKKCGFLPKAVTPFLPFNFLLLNYLNFQRFTPGARKYCHRFVTFTPGQIRLNC